MCSSLKLFCRMCIFAIRVDGGRQPSVSLPILPTIRAQLPRLMFFMTCHMFPVSEWKRLRCKVAPHSNEMNRENSFIILLGQKRATQRRERFSFKKSSFAAPLLPLSTNNYRGRFLPRNSRDSANRLMREFLK